MNTSYKIIAVEKPLIKTDAEGIDIPETPLKEILQKVLPKHFFKDTKLMTFTHGVTQDGSPNKKGIHTTLSSVKDITFRDFEIPNSNGLYFGFMNTNSQGIAKQQGHGILIRHVGPQKEPEGLGITYPTGYPSDGGALQYSTINEHIEVTYGLFNQGELVFGYNLRSNINGSFTLYIAKQYCTDCISHVDNLHSYKSERNLEEWLTIQKQKASLGEPHTPDSNFATFRDLVMESILASSPTSFR